MLRAILSHRNSFIMQFSTILAAALFSLTAVASPLAANLVEVRSLLQPNH